MTKWHGWTNELFVLTQIFKMLKDVDKYVLVHHYAKIWFLWLRHVTTIVQNNYVVVSGFES